MISFRNRNEMNLEATILLGVHSKVGQNPNGYFGTGLKFAIATIMRNGGTVVIYTGTKPNIFTTERVRVRPDADDYVDVILMNNERVGFTTQLGKNWELWQAFRELYNNCHDEPEAVVTNTPLGSLVGYTLIAVSGCPEFEAVYERRNEFILATEPKYVGLLATIHPGGSDNIFYRGNLAAKLEKPSLFTYNLSASQTLTEDRTLKYPYLANSAIATTLVACSDEKILRRVFDADHIYFEHNLSYDECGLDPSETFLNVVGEYRKAGKHVPKSAIRVYDKHRDDMVGDGTRIQLSQNEKDMLEEAYKVIERAIGVNVRTIPLVAVESLGASVYGLADNGRIYIARKAFDAGLPFVVGTLFEEYGHLLWHWRDETRDMQNSLVNRCASLMIELAKYKPAHAGHGNYRASVNPRAGGPCTLLVMSDLSALQRRADRTSSSHTTRTNPRRTTMTPDETIALTALREEAESNNGNGWRDCYLDNAKPSDWSPKKWASILGSLTKKGFYKDIQDPDYKGVWGSVKMED